MPTYMDDLITPLFCESVVVCTVLVLSTYRCCRRYGCGCFRSIPRGYSYPPLLKSTRNLKSNAYVVKHKLKGIINKLCLHCFY